MRDTVGKQQALYDVLVGGGCGEDRETHTPRERGTSSQRPGERV